MEQKAIAGLIRQVVTEAGVTPGPHKQAPPVHSSGAFHCLHLCDVRPPAPGFRRGFFSCHRVQFALMDLALQNTVRGSAIEDDA